ncbi:MAG: hypothetical protein FWG97_00075 [Deltaproteobacteria bacterium]|nr:hypothetical protein [Deltaproteobacteria bacterium]
MTVPHLKHQLKTRRHSPRVHYRRLIFAFDPAYFPVYPPSWHLFQIQSGACDWLFDIFPATPAEQAVFHGAAFAGAAIWHGDPSGMDDFHGSYFDDAGVNQGPGRPGAPPGL